MANRYLRATGNWNGAVWASTAGGTAGSAATPTAGDDVYIAANFTVTLTANTSCNSLEHSSGSIVLSSYKLSVIDSDGFGGYYSVSGTGSKTLDMGSGILEITASGDDDTAFYSSGSNFTVIPGTSKLILNVSGLYGVFETQSKIFNDVIINMGSGASDITSFSIDGSPTFRLLYIRSTNTAAQTVNIGSGSITVEKFVGLGASTANRLLITDSGLNGAISATSGGSFYGQFLNMDVLGAMSDDPPQYIGSNSIAKAGTTWIAQDPPKTSTLVDPLTTAPGSNTNWTTTGTITQIATGADGGGYTFDSTDSITSINTYDVIDSSIVFEIMPVATSANNGSVGFGVGWFDGTTFGGSDLFITNGFAIGFSIEWFEGVIMSVGADYRSESTNGIYTTVTTLPTTTPIYLKIAVSGSTATTHISTGGAFTQIASATLTDTELNFLRSSRIFVDAPSNSDVYSIGSINPNLNASPTVTFQFPADNVTLTTTTPYFVFAATDPEGENVSYQIQISTDSSFSSTFIDALSASDPGFSGTDSHNSAYQVTYTVQTPLTPGGIAYYWRVRAKDPSGSNSFGAWSANRTVITQATAPSVTTGVSSSILATTATTAGNVTSTNGANVTERGIAYATTANPTTSNSKKTSGSGAGAFTANLTGLSTNTLYNYRAYAINSIGTSYGSNETFTTAPGVATPTITSITDVTFDTATVNTDVTQSDGAAITERGVVYALTANPTTANTKITSGTGTGAFIANLTGLTDSTTYYVRSYAINASGTYYSPQATFNTQQTPSAPSVTTGSAAFTADITSKFNGNEVTLDGTSTVTERGIVFSDTATTPTTTDQKIVDAAVGLGTYNLGMTGLDPSTLYYVRAYVINSIGTGYGSVVSFTTAAPFMPDEGDGYWTWTPSGSDAVVGRSQSTLANSSTDLILADLGLTDGLDYTFYYSGDTSDNGVTKVVLQWFVGATKTQQLITPGTAHTFTYNETYTNWSIRLFVTGALVEAANINATFSDMYLAQESTFSGYVPFVANGLTEIKVENNWLVDKQRTDVIASMFTAMNGLSWFPFDIDTEGLGWFEIGDRFTIQDSDANEYSVVLWNSKLTVDGGIKETLFTKTPDLTETNYNKAGKLGGLWKRTQIEVDKNKQEIQALVEDVYSYDGVINTKFSQVDQDVNEVRTTVQGSGGVNLVQNSVMYAFDTSNVPDSWTVAGTGTLLIQSSPESLTAGAVAGNAFALSDKTVTQTITVRKDVDFILEDDKTYYSFSAKVKKNTVGVASITLTNRNETLTIALPDQESYYWDTVKLEGILPLDDHYDIAIYSDIDANLQVTDVIFAPGKTKREWTQANGEVMNSSVSITEDGMTIRSPQFINDYTTIDSLGFEVHSKEVYGERVFGFNKDETNVSKLKSDKQMSMPPLRVVPINYGTYKGWAFTLSEEII